VLCAKRLDPVPPDSPGAGLSAGSVRDSELPRAAGQLARHRIAVMPVPLPRSVPTRPESPFDSAQRAHTMQHVGIRAGIHELGPDTASLVVKTYREGLAAMAGHDLIIEVRQWEATLEIGEDPSDPRLELRADPRSLYPREGLRGVKPLTDKDRDEVRKNIDKKVLGGEPISFRSSAVKAAGDGRLQVRGELTIRGQSRPAGFELSVGADGHVTGTARLVQSDWGIKPYRGLMGALKVRDSLEVVFDGVLPTD
jgi:polyisoprenoid-binding protein YceI